jgi:hypothetical protein
MSRYRYRILVLPRTDIEPGYYHDGDAQDAQCLADTETDDGCEFCQMEMDEASEILAKQEAGNGYEVWDHMLTNDPWSDRDEGWEFWVKERKL